MPTPAASPTSTPAAPPAASAHDALDAAGRGYPRPQLVRADFRSLNGEWRFALDRDGRCLTPGEVKFDRTIAVPFAPECPASGVPKREKAGDGYLPGFIQRAWYRREFDRPAMAEGHRLILHFGAVDHVAHVWVNGKSAGRHEGGYTPFSFDVTDLLKPKGKQTVEVRADDDPHDLAKPRGKQDWLPEAHGIWYPRTTGIWQTVWLECVPPARVAALRWRPDLPAGAMGLLATFHGEPPEGARLAVTLTCGGRTLADDSYLVDRTVGDGGEVRRTIQVAPGPVDDFAVPIVWSPGDPKLIDARVRLLDAKGRTLDDVASYCALRSVTTAGDRVALNRRPYKLRLALDQGYWPDTGLTAPDDAALRRDVELIRELGFDGVRKHQKVEDPRFLYWADRLGVLVWGEMPSAYRFTETAGRRLATEWADVVRRDESHPCVVAWVPFNESWGVPDLPTDPAHRHLVRALFHLTKSLDPTRPAIGNDGWEAVAGDLVGVHDYDRWPDHLRERYRVAPAELADRLKATGPAGRVLSLLAAEEGRPFAGEPTLLTEFGGIAYSDEAGDWGYSRAESPDDLAARYEALLAAVHATPAFAAGFCYTQLTDTYQEANGLLFMDRRPKCDVERLRKATRG